MRRDIRVAPRNLAFTENQRHPGLTSWTATCTEATCDSNMPDNSSSGQNGESNPCAEVARELMMYLLRHREARDTVEGILDWWLPGTTVRRSDLEAALKELCRRGWIESERRSTDVVLFGLNKAKVNEILEYLTNNN